MVNTPFKFLDSYTREDQEIFFGREREVEELYYKIFESSLLIVYGSSGTGKTSLIQCGLAGKFQESDWMPIVIRRGNNINESITNALQNIALTPLKKKNNLPKNIQSVYLDFFKPIYMLFDQFEELFIFGNDAEIEEFIDSIKACLEANLTCRFLFVIRGEYLENIARFEDKIPDFFNNRMRIERMTRKNAMRAITEPARLFNIQVSEDFPVQALEKLSPDKASVELTYLQVYLDKLYKSAVVKNAAQPVFNEELIQQSGDIDDVLASFLDEQIAKTENPEEALIILKSFVSNEGTKKQMAVNEVTDFTLALGKKVSHETVDHYLRQLVDLRILKDKDENGKYELRHDALAAKIFEQISYTEKELLEVRQFILNRFNEFKKRGIYLEYGDIAYIRPYENKMFLNAEQKEFIEKSAKAARQKKTRRRNIIVGATSMVFITLVCFSVYAFNQQNQAILQTEIAEKEKQEALNQKALAELAKEKALKASKEALTAQQYAELQSNIANEQKKMADEQALKAKEQTNLAIAQQKIADEQKLAAEQEKQKADDERKKAEEAQLKADRLRLIELSQSVAFKALQIKNDLQLQGLLSSSAYSLAKDNGGNIQDPQLYSSLFQSLKNLGQAYPAEIRMQAETQAMNISADGKIAALLADGSIHYYSEDNRQSGNMQLKTSGINTAYLSPKAGFAITAYEDNSIKIWNISANTSSTFLTGHTGLVRAAAFSNDGSQYATGGRDCTVIIWSSNQLLKKFSCPARIRALAMSADKSKILAGCEDGSVWQYDISNGTKSAFASYSPNRVESIVYSAGGKYIIVSASNGAIHIFNAAGSLVKTLQESAGVEFICANDDEGLLAAATSNRLIRIYNLNELSRKPVEINDIKARIVAMTLTEQGNIYVALANNTIRRYTAKSSVLQGMISPLLNRNLSQEEWNTYIGMDVPYKK